MAIHTNTDTSAETTQQTTVGADNGQQATQQQTTSLAGNSLTNIGLLTAVSAGDLNQIANKMKAHLKNGKIPGDVYVIPRAQVPELAYDTVVIGVQNSGTMYFYVIMFGASGDRPMTRSEFLQQLRTTRSAFTPTDALDSVMVQLVTTSLRAAEPNVNEFKYMDGIFVPHNIELTDELGQILATLGYNTCITQMTLDHNAAHDVTISELIKANGGSKLTLTNYALRDYYVDRVGRRRRVEFAVDLAAMLNKSLTTPNTLGGTHSIASAKGNVLFLPKEEQYINPQTNLPINVVKFGPVININTIEANVPSLGYAILAIASSMVEAKGDQWLHAVVSNLDKHNVGVLNLYANINGSEKPGVLKLNDPKMKDQTKYQQVKALVPLEPLVSLDIEAFTENSAVLSAFAAVANYNNAEAAKDIHETCTHLTDGIYQYRGPIFATNKVTLPVGDWTDSKGVERTLDDVDILYTIEHGQNVPNLISEFIKTEVGATGDSFTERLLQLEALKIEAVITGRKTRNIFHKDFVESLLNALTQAGFSPRFEANETILQQTGFGFTAGLFDNAAIHTVPGFAAYSGQSQTFGNPYGFLQTGNYRYQ